MWTIFKEVIRKTVRNLLFSFIGISFGTSENNNNQNIDCVIKFQIHEYNLICITLWKLRKILSTHVAKSQNQQN